jgi:hypothetical protein
LVLHDAIVPRGTDVMLFGYPEMLVLGTSLKATRGSISSIPDPQGSLPSRQGTSSTVNSKYLYDAVSNAGNSGGPLCDAGANVVAVHSTGYNTASRYAGGVPSTQAIEFVRRTLPDYRPAAIATAKLEWPQVDERASASTMLIWIRRKNVKAESASVGGDVIELPFCLFCGGLGKLKCGYPGCVNGQVTLRTGRRDCPKCNGAGALGCDVCDGVGLDVRLASVQRAIDAAKATTSTPTPATTTATATAPGPQRPGAVESFGGHRYQVLLGEVAWTAAQAKCQELGGKLVSIGTQDEDLFVRQLIERTIGAGQLGQERNKFWIGARLVNGVWQWVSGEPFEYMPNTPAANASSPYLRHAGARWIPAPERSSLVVGYVCEWER